MSKGETGFDGVKIFNERSTDVYVQVQMVGQQGGNVVLNGDSSRVQVPPNTTRTALDSGAALHMPPATCALVSVYGSDAQTLLASFGTLGLECRRDGVVKTIAGVEVRVGTD